MIAGIAGQEPRGETIETRFTSPNSRGAEAKPPRHAAGPFRAMRIG
jgi:hypothetical protein